VPAPGPRLTTLRCSAKITGVTIDGRARRGSLPNLVAVFGKSGGRPASRPSAGLAANRLQTVLAPHARIADATVVNRVASSSQHGHAGLTRSLWQPVDSHLAERVPQCCCSSSPSVCELRILVDQQRSVTQFKLRPHHDRERGLAMIRTRQQRCTIADYVFHHRIRHDREIVASQSIDGYWRQSHAGGAKRRNHYTVMAVLVVTAGPYS